jgi:hypothetical protein
MLAHLDTKIKRDVWRSDHKTGREAVHWTSLYHALRPNSPLAPLVATARVVYIHHIVVHPVARRIALALPARPGAAETPKPRIFSEINNENKHTDLETSHSSNPRSRLFIAPTPYRLPDVMCERASALYPVSLYRSDPSSLNIAFTGCSDPLSMRQPPAPRQ